MGIALMKGDQEHRLLTLTPKEQIEAMTFLAQATGLDREERRHVLRLAELSMIEHAADGSLTDQERKGLLRSIQDFARRTGTHAGVGHELTHAAFQQLQLVDSGDALALSLLEGRANAAQQEIAQRLFKFVSVPDAAPESAALIGRDQLPTELLIRWMEAPASQAPHQP
jgi:hypothetical protein